MRQNYLATLAFVEKIENLCPTVRQLQTLRAHPSYTAFMKRWQLPVYFQLRFKEIAGSLESALSAHSSTSFFLALSLDQCAS